MITLGMGELLEDICSRPMGLLTAEFSSEISESICAEKVLALTPDSMDAELYS